jgi:hypothetical protein
MTASVTLVVNRRFEAFDVYIGRGSIWGNPFANMPRDAAIDHFREWIATQPQLLARLHELKGKRLGCYCSPKRCHGEILAELADELTGL